MMNPLMYRHQPGPHFPVLPYVHGMMQPRRDVNDEEDLASVSLQVQKKRFYVDVKKNRRGRFMKIAEVGVDGRKARILLTMPAAVELKDKLKDLIEVLADTEKKNESQESSGENVLENAEDKNGDSSVNDGLIKSHIINYPNRRYYLDLKKNRRGYFLRLAMLSAYVRIQLAVPAQGMSQLCSVITDLLEKWWDGSTQDSDLKGVNLPASKSLRVDNKTFYFDSLAHPRRLGVFLRISEVKPDSRTAITIPARSLIRFRDVINELAENLANVKVKKEGEFEEVEIEVEDGEADKEENADIEISVENGDPQVNSEGEN